MVNAKINGQIVTPSTFKAKINGQIVNPTALRIKVNGSWVDVWENWSPQVDVNKILYDGTPNGFVDLVVQSALNFEYVTKAIEKGYANVQMIGEIRCFTGTLREIFASRPFGETYVISCYRGIESDPMQYNLEDVGQYYSLSQNNTALYDFDFRLSRLSAVVTSYQPNLSYRVHIPPTEGKRIQVKIVRLECK